MKTKDYQEASRKLNEFVAQSKKVRRIRSINRLKNRVELFSNVMASAQRFINDVKKFSDAFKEQQKASFPVGGYTGDGKHTEAGIVHPREHVHDALKYATHTVDYEDVQKRYFRPQNGCVDFPMVSFPDCGE